MAAKKAKKSILYTRTGDDCTSSLYTGERRSKTDATFDTLGEIDELNANLGLAKHYCIEEKNGLASILQTVQCCLQDLMSHVATPNPLDADEEPDDEKIAMVQFDVDGKLIESLEAAIDEIDAQLPALTKFILPSGGAAATHLHVARAACRRAERAVSSLVLRKACGKPAQRFINRLSDLLFAIARFAAFSAEIEESFSEKGDRVFHVPKLNPPSKDEGQVQKLSDNVQELLQFKAQCEKKQSQSDNNRLSVVAVVAAITVMWVFKSRMTSPSVVQSFF